MMMNKTWTSLDTPTISKIKNKFLSVLNIILITAMFLQLHIKEPVIR